MDVYCDLGISLEGIVMFVENRVKEANEVGGSKNGSGDPNDNGLIKGFCSFFTIFVSTLDRILDGGVRN